MAQRSGGLLFVRLLGLRSLVRGRVLGHGLGGGRVLGGLGSRGLRGWGLRGRGVLARTADPPPRPGADLFQDQLDDGHGGVVALARPDLGDPGVATVALGEAGPDLGEQRVHDPLVGNDREHLPPGVQVTPLGEGDQPLGHRPEPAGLGLGGGDPPMLEQRGGQVRQDVPLVGRTAAQPRPFRGRGHWFPLSRSVNEVPAVSVLLGLDVAVVLVAGVVVHHGARVESGRGVLEGQAHVDQLLLDFLDGLRAEVPYIEEVLLAAGHELADRVDALALEAVVRANREVQVLDGQSQVRRQGRVRGRRANVDAFGVDVELAGQAEQLDQGLARTRHRVPRPDGGLGLHVEDQPVKVGPLLNTGRLDLVADPGHRGVDRVDGPPADLLAGLLVLGRRDVAATALDGQLHLQLALAVQGRDVQVRVVDLDPGGWGDVGRADLARTLLAQVHDHGLVVLGGDHETLEVQDDVGDILLDARHGGELVQHALDPDAGDRRARNGRQQRAPERVADRVTEARLQRLDDEPRPGVAYLLFRQGGTLSDKHVTFFPRGARYLTPRSVPRRPLFDVAILPAAT